LFVAIVGGLYRPYLIVELVSRRSPDKIVEELAGGVVVGYLIQWTQSLKYLSPDEAKFTDSR
jgi:hypothetical protein